MDVLSMCGHICRILKPRNLVLRSMLIKRQEWRRVMHLLHISRYFLSCVLSFCHITFSGSYIWVCVLHMIYVSTRNPQLLWLLNFWMVLLFDLAGRSLCLLHKLSLSRKVSIILFMSGFSFMDYGKGWLIMVCLCFGIYNTLFASL